MKVCQHTGCTSPVFSTHRCLRHQSDRTDDKWLKSLAKRAEKARSLRRQPKPPLQSKTRSSQAILYKEVCDELDRDAVNNGTNICFFCGERIYGSCDHHHLRGRNGSLYTDKRYLIRAHNECHVEIYHGGSTRQLISMNWYVEFLLRLGDKDEISYRKEIKKIKKYLESSLKKYTFDT